MDDEIIDVEDYEVKDKQIVKDSNEETYQREDYQNEPRFYKSFALDNTALLIIMMVIVLLIAIFIMTFD
ncbi:hypothetical protein [Methanobrevibacter olleyae]|uniref:Uncharacterized protein n=1 Tax=Methanobrevibacter olleyae TaxID=294671 RepID=A0A126R165_METOL|nr:hypothetical protein [Methanobrevibacter olleyae]AMK15812.1 hypothetical protein YLM1_1255 [Methanobrevibacter olleyae]SFL19719.1 hypothetical protein SAMN02910297_00180 [Methanobrevibacter olleyae]